MTPEQLLELRTNLRAIATANPANVLALLDQIELLTKAFELATEHGLTYQYEGWGGRRKSGHTPAAEYRELVLNRAREALAK